MRPNIHISTDGKEYHIKIENLFEKQTSQVFSFTEPDPTEHNIKLHIHRLFDILKDKAPSGNLKPSEADNRLTRDLKQSGDIIGIKVLDHLILTANSYYSFADEGMI